MAIYLGDLELATGGGATGTGLPVNTYESFYISGNSNPSGYNATTGLYTHPNGDIWLKTGNTINSSGTNPYPSSTYSGGFTNSFNRYNSVSAGISNDARIGVGKTKLVGTGSVTTPTLYYYNSTNLASLGTKQSISLGSTDSFAGTPSIGFNRNTDEFYVVGLNGGARNRIMKISEATLAVNSYTGVYSEITNYITGTAFDFTNGFYYLLNGDGLSQSHIYQYDLATDAYTGVNLFAGNTGSNGLAIQGFTFDGTYLIIANRQPTSNNSQTLEFYATNNGTALSYAGSMSTPGVDYRDLKFDHNTNNKFYVSVYSDNWQNANTPIYTQNYIFGDSTARTDTDSGQPLFIKLK